MPWRDLPKFVRPRTRPNRVFVRFGRWGDWGERSRNHRTGEFEAGVSVCPAFLNSDDTVSLDHSGCLGIWWEQVPGRLAFAVTGRISGTGSDGEPVLRKVKCLAYAIDYRSIPDPVKEKCESDCSQSRSSERCK